ncbi:MAG: hypothetical protein NVSMB22_00430 [Chloroflexota bacterium]
MWAADRHVPDPYDTGVPAFGKGHGTEAVRRVTLDDKTALESIRLYAVKVMVSERDRSRRQSAFRVSDSERKPTKVLRLTPWVDLQVKLPTDAKPDIPRDSNTDPTPLAARTASGRRDSRLRPNDLDARCAPFSLLLGTALGIHPKILP